MNCRSDVAGLTLSEINELSGPKIRNFDAKRVVEKQVLRFEISASTSQ